MSRVQVVDIDGSGRKIRVIIAEDHGVVREGTRQLLEREPDIEVVGEAANGVEALRLVEEVEPDVAIVDISMPVMGGIEATERIKQLRPSTAVLILTAYDDDPYVFTLLNVGAAGYLLKDVPSAEVVRAVRAVYSGEPVLHPTVVRKVLAKLALDQKAQLVKHEAEPAALETSPLTPREMEVLRLAAMGMTNSQIAETLYFSIRTVQVHMTHIFTKLDVGSRTEAVIAGLRRGLISIEDIREG